MLKGIYEVGDLIISETALMVCNYHLRIIGEEGPKFRGGAKNSLCGKQLGWDLRAPKSSWGAKDYTILKYCAECEEIAKNQGMLPTPDDTHL